MNLGDILEGGQGRRKRLNESLGETLKYYLGPTGIPERVAMLGEVLNPVVGMEQASTASKDMMDPSKSLWDRVGAGGRMATEIAGVAAPMGAARMAGVGSDDAARAIQEALTGFSATPSAVAGKDFAMDEAGAIRAWHGSPHDFDKFSLDKIGTGEGAQAYGHGLYFAESPGVARSYRDALSNTDAPLAVWKRPDGSEIDALDVPGSVALLRGDKLDVSHTDLVDAAKKELARASSVRNSQLREVQTRKAQEALDWLQKNEGIALSTHPERGRLYEVEIDANPEDFLDWDKPLSEQSPKAQAAMDDFLTWFQGEDGRQNIYDSGTELSGLTKYSDDLSQDQLTTAMRARGIPGIRYLDQGSRGAGDGTSNYVVFDDNLVSIIKKYGIAGAAAMLGMSAEELQAQADEQGQAPLKDYLGK